MIWPNQKPNPRDQKWWMTMGWVDGGIWITAVLTGGHFDPFARISSPYSAVVLEHTHTHIHTNYMAFLAAAIKHAVRVKARLPGRYIVVGIIYPTRYIRWRCKSRKGCCCSANGRVAIYIIIYILYAVRRGPQTGAVRFYTTPSTPTAGHFRCHDVIPAAAEMRTVPKIACTYSYLMS